MSISLGRGRAVLSLGSVLLMLLISAAAAGAENNDAESSEAATVFGGLAESRTPTICGIQGIQDTHDLQEFS